MATADELEMAPRVSTGAPRRQPRNVDDDDVPVKGNGPGLEVAVIGTLGAALAASGAATDLATGRIHASSTHPAFSIRTSAWELCLSLQYGSASSTTGTATDPRLAIGCRPLEDSICADESSVALHLSRAMQVITVLLCVYIALYGALHRLHLLDEGRCLGCLYTCVNKRRHYVIVSIATLIASIAAVCATGSMLAWDCLGDRAAVSAGFIVLCVTILATGALVVVAMYHRNSLDYEAINRVISERAARTQEIADAHRQRARAAQSGPGGPPVGGHTPLSMGNARIVDDDDDR